MIKQIKTEQLREGMFVHNLDCHWLDHPFFRSQFMVTGDEEITRVREAGIVQLYIDTSKGLDVRDAPTKEEVKAELQRQMVDALARREPLPSQASYREEIVRAKEIRNEAEQVVHGLMNDLRMGKQIEVEKIEPTVEKITDSILRNKDALLSLVRIKQRDAYTYQHSVAVCALLVSFCRALGYRKDAIKEIGFGGLLHDTGKMGIPDEILNKPGRLEPSELAIMQRHVTIGVEILKNTPGISPAAILIAEQHHERSDGSGYPSSLAGDDISLFGQMSSIVDVYDALTSDRVYHKGMSPTDALRKIFSWSKFHFNPELVEQFIQSLGIYPVGTLVRLESGLVGIVLEQGRRDLSRPVVRILYDTKRESAVSRWDMDLSDAMGRGGGDRILRHENPADWNINPLDHL